MLDTEAQLIGSALGGYTIESLIRSDPLATVYLATHRRSKREVALKVLWARIGDDPAYRERCTREAQLAASLDHPNLIPVYEADQDAGLFYIAMRHVEGGDLRQLLDRKGRLGLVRTLVIVEQVASALDAMHAASAVHWDVKPANVLLGDAGHVYLADLGVARVVKRVDVRRDISALGYVAYQCLAGRWQSDFAAIEARNIPPLLSIARPGLPIALDAVLARAMAADPEDHFQTAGSMAQSLRLAGLGSESCGITLWPQLSKG